MLEDLLFEVQLAMPQVILGVINGAFYALLSLGLAVIFGMLNVINFAHGAQFTLGAFVAWMLLSWAGIGYWPALLLAPLIVGALGVVMERTMIARLYRIDHLYGLLLTFGCALVIEGVLRNNFGSSGQRYAPPREFAALDLELGDFFLPGYRVWVLVAATAMCLATWLVIEKTKVGSYLRAATERPQLVQAFGINVPLMMTLTYGAGVALAGFAGVLAAPIYSVSPAMGANFIITVFAVVVIGGMGSIAGSIVTGFMLGLVQGITEVFYPEASQTVVFVIMAVVLLTRPAGLFGRA
ncbi:branched-chain amino acid ABC transporter permease [Falsiroseomonas sp. CW058]|uniref:branched-chain amino acid ABC transporter permease n=1 Tax=Falsiroseomonas sp. CW058 TaxID=3388664 RepID=UPI003D320472